MSQVAIGSVLIGYVAFLFSICFHEFAHGWMAQKKGDNTAQLMGRLTLNPVAHADILGTVILPLWMFMGGFGFGWAKPVPVNPRNLKNPRQDMFWVAAAGPGSNLLLAFIGVVALVVGWRAFQGSPPQVFLKFFQFFVHINLILCFFNLIPLHPLDGGKILARFLPENMNRKLEEAQQYSMMLLFGLLMIGFMVPQISPLRYLVLMPSQIVFNGMLSMVEAMIP